MQISICLVSVSLCSQSFLFLLTSTLPLWIILVPLIVSVECLELATSPWHIQFKAALCSMWSLLVSSGFFSCIPGRSIEPCLADSIPCFHETELPSPAQTLGSELTKKLIFKHYHIDSEEPQPVLLSFFRASAITLLLFYAYANTFFIQEAKGFREVY